MKSKIKKKIEAIACLPPRTMLISFLGFKIPPKVLNTSLLNMVPDQLVEYIILPHFSHPHSTWVLKDDKVMVKSIKRLKLAETWLNL